MQTRSIVVLGAAGVMILASLIVLGLRQTRQGPPDAAGAAGAADGVPTIQFVRNPAPVPSMTFTDLDGNVISTGDWAGKVTLVNFWATWCPPCREEIPDFVAMQEHYRDRLQIVGVSLDEGSVEDVRRFAEEYEINYPIVMLTEELATAFPGVFALPTTFVLDPEVRTVQKHIGLINPHLYELATRVLTGMAVEVNVEYVEDTGQVLLANAAHATEIPGVDLSHLTPDQKTEALRRLNEELCTCGCGLTVAQCRINDSTCTTSPKVAQQIVDEVSSL